jgi:uncharacterized protein (DUF58 family)
MNDSPSPPVRFRALGLYLLVLILAFLAGSYVVPFFFCVFLLLLLLPVVSLCCLLLGFLSLKYHQEFSTEHPVKGEWVAHRLALSNETFLPLHHVRVRFKAVHPGMAEQQPDFQAYLRARGRLEREYRIHCPFRGIYTVGLQTLEAQDPLHLFTLRRPVWYRTFYVYPRVLPLKGFTTGLERSERLSQGSSTGAVPDYALFSRLRSYRRGESLRHVSWKKFAATGHPYLKEYDTSAEPGVSIYFDLREMDLPVLKALETEDVSVEILVALVKFYLDAGVPVSVHAPGRSLFHFRGSSPTDFQAFHKATMELLFQRTISPAALYRSDRQSGSADGSSVILVSHLFDAETFALVEDALAGEQPVSLVLNQNGCSREQRRQLQPYLDTLKDRGANIRLVRGPESISEELSGGGPWP